MTDYTSIVRTDKEINSIMSTSDAIAILDKASEKIASGVLSSSTWYNDLRVFFNFLIGRGYIYEEALDAQTKVLHAVNYLMRTGFSGARRNM